MHPRDKPTQGWEPFLVPFFLKILNRTNNIFELVTVKAVKAGEQRKTEQLMLKDAENDDEERKLRLKGQMIYMDNWRLIMWEEMSVTGGRNWLSSVQVPWDAGDAEIVIPHLDGVIHKRSVDAWFLEVIWPWQKSL